MLLLAIIGGVLVTILSAVGLTVIITLVINGLEKE